ncbi:hypothetical protein LINGRAHAP2_LOCUS25589 [Linum grandiflorum]
MQYHKLSKRQWEVTLNHIYREANYAADYLTNLGHSSLFDFHIVSVPDIRVYPTSFVMTLLVC